MEIANAGLFRSVTEAELFDVDGGVNWGSVADAAGGIAVIAAFIAPAFPPAAVVGLVCASFYVGYKIGQALK